MIGMIFFWLDYIICGLALYSFIFCRYKSIKLDYNYAEHKYDKECTNVRIKTPLWGVLLLTLLWFIPVLNIIITIPFMLIHYNESNYCYKSFLTKEI